MLSGEQFQTHEQLSMFEPAHKLKAAIDAGTLHTGDNQSESSGEDMPMSQMWRIKRREAMWDNTYQSVHKEGVHKPLHIFHDPQGMEEEPGPHLWDGHHRLISAYDKDPNTEVPVKHNNEATYTQFLNSSFGKGFGS